MSHVAVSRSGITSMLLNFRPVGKALSNAAIRLSVCLSLCVFRTPGSKMVHFRAMITIED